MSETTLISQLNILQQKLVSLLERHQTLQKELEETKEENKTLKHTIKQQKSELQGFQYQEEITKIVDSVLVNGDGVEELKDRINQYIQEIDIVVNFLNKEL